MADIVDTANDHAELILQMSVAQQQRAKRLVPTGQCFFCEDPTPDNALFCSSGCRDDWEREQQAKARNGRT